MKKLAVVGLGAIGCMHIDNLLAKKVLDAEVVAICDENIKQPDKYILLDYYADLDNMLAKGGFDAVILATPSFTHHSLALKVLNAGYNVLIEKPVALCTADALEVKKIAQEKNLTCAVMLNQRTTPLYMRIKELVDTGFFGKINRISWTMSNWYRPNIYFSSSLWRGTWKGEAGGVLINQSIHNIDIWAWIFGMPKALRAYCKYGKYHDIEVEDEVSCFLKLVDNGNATFITSTGEYPGSNRLVIAGDKAFVVAEGGKLKISTFGHESLSEFTENTDQMFGSPEVETREEEFFGSGQQHVGVIQNFVDTLLGRAELMYSVDEGIKSLELANAMLLSDWKDSEIELSLNHEEYKEHLNEKMEKSNLRQNLNKVAEVDFGKSFK